MESSSRVRKSRLRCRRVIACGFLLIALVLIQDLTWSPRKLMEYTSSTNRTTTTEHAPSYSGETFLIPKHMSDLHALEEKLQRAGMPVKSVLAACSPTVQFQLLIPPPSNHTNAVVPFWVLQSLDKEGKPKSKGGDELYVEYTDRNDPNWGRNYLDPTAVAQIQDLQNGQYRLEFTRPPMAQHKNSSLEQLSGQGKLNIHLQYTCGIGAIPRPLKDDWKTNGAVLLLFSREGILRPWIRPFVPSPRHDLSRHQVVLCVGDSMIENFCGKYWNQHQYRHENVYMKEKIGSELTLETVEQTFLKNIEDWYGNEYLSNSSLTETSGQVAILTGSAVWDLLDSNRERETRDWKDHLAATRQYIQALRERYPKASIYWKLPSAVHVHKLNDNCFRNEMRYEPCQIRTKYMSSSLMYELYTLQKDLMKELQVPVLDLYKASFLSANWLMPGDGRHYRRWFNQLTSNFYYPGSKLDR